MVIESFALDLLRFCFLESARILCFVNQAINSSGSVYFFTI